MSARIRNYSLIYLHQINNKKLTTFLLLLQVFRLIVDRQDCLFQLCQPLLKRSQYADHTCSELRASQGSILQEYKPHRLL